MEESRNTIEILKYAFGEIIEKILFKIILRYAFGKIYLETIPHQKLLRSEK